MGRFTQMAKEAMDLTDREITDGIASLARLSRDDVTALLPSRRDQETFVKLMHEVESERTEAEKLAFLRDNLSTAGKVVLQVLGALV